MGYLNYSGLSRFLGKIQTLLSSKKDRQSAVSDPSASGTAESFIDTISQNQNGVITATKKTVRTMGAAGSGTNGTSGLVPAPAAGKQTSYLRGDGTWAVPTNTKNTAGSTDTGSKIYLVGATTQAANPQTYSQDTAYVGTDGCLYSGGQKVLTSHQDISGKLDIDQGTENEGCYMVVDENGSLVPENVPVCVGIPDEMDRIGRVRITSANATDATFPFVYSDEDYALELSCIYAGSVHIYMSGAEYTSNLDLSEYQDTEMLVFSNTLMIGSTVFHFVWMIDTEEEEAKVVAYSGETMTRLDTLFSSGGFARIELNVRKVQAEPY